MITEDLRVVYLYNEGSWQAYIPLNPGIGTGKTKEEARDNLILNLQSLIKFSIIHANESIRTYDYPQNDNLN